MASCVLFDIDGTLVDTTYLHALACWRALVEMGQDSQGTTEGRGKTPRRSSAVVSSGPEVGFRKTTPGTGGTVTVRARDGDPLSWRRPKLSHGSAPSSRGLGHHPLKVKTRVRIPLGLR